MLISKVVRFLVTVSLVCELARTIEKTQCVDWRFISRRKILVLIQKRIRVDGT